MFMELPPCDVVPAGEQGDELERQAALETAALDPPHTYVPWCA